MSAIWASARAPDVQRTVEEDVEILPDGWMEYGGTFEQLQSAAQRLLIVEQVKLALFVGLLVVAAGSFQYAGAVFTDVLFALAGGIVSLTLLTLVVLSGCVD